MNANREFPFVEFTDDEPQVGDWAVAVGNPFGLVGSVSAGIISGYGRNIGSGPYDDFLQIDAPINRGNLGGPTFNLQGEVIGVNTAIYSPSGGSVGIGFAIPADVVQEVVAELREDGEVTRGWLGVAIQPVTEDMAGALGMDEARGAIVVEAQQGSPANEAGIRSGDVIVELNGEVVQDARDLSFKVARLDPGEEVEFGIIRDGDERTVEVEIGQEESERDIAVDSEDEETSFDELGMTLAPAGSVAGAGEDGVVITDVDPNGPAAEKGVSAGDVILEVGGEAVSRPEDVAEAFRKAEESGRTAILMHLRSGEQTRFVALELPPERG